MLIPLDSPPILKRRWLMAKELFSQKLLRLLDASTGKHGQIAKEAGISQATISRIYLRKVSPSLRNAEALMSWFEDDAEKQEKTQTAASNQPQVLLQ